MKLLILLLFIVGEPSAVDGSDTLDLGGCKPISETVGSIPTTYDRRDDDDDDLWFIWQEQKKANAQAERERDCNRCIQEHLANNESLSWALQVCPCD